MKTAAEWAKYAEGTELWSLEECFAQAMREAVAEMS